MVSHRLNVTIPEELKKRVDKYNKENPSRPLNISAVLQVALSDLLEKEGY
jgi:post-segregation antitoxin (ccd killing protein)